MQKKTQKKKEKEESYLNVSYEWTWEESYYMYTYIIGGASYVIILHYY